VLARLGGGAAAAQVAAHFQRWARAWEADIRVAAAADAEHAHSPAHAAAERSASVWSASESASEPVCREPATVPGTTEGPAVGREVALAAPGEQAACAVGEGLLGASAARAAVEREAAGCAAALAPAFGAATAAGLAALLGSLYRRRAELESAAAEPHAATAQQPQSDEGAGEPAAGCAGTAGSALRPVPDDASEHASRQQDRSAAAESSATVSSSGPAAAEPGAVMARGGGMWVSTSLRVDPASGQVALQLRPRAAAPPLQRTPGCDSTIAGRHSTLANLAATPRACQPPAGAAVDSTGGPQLDGCAAASPGGPAAAAGLSAAARACSGAGGAPVRKRSGSASLPPAGATAAAALDEPDAPPAPASGRRGAAGGGLAAAAPAAAADTDALDGSPACAAAPALARAAAPALEAPAAPALGGARQAGTLRASEGLEIRGSPAPGIPQAGLEALQHELHKARAAAAAAHAEAAALRRQLLAGSGSGPGPDAALAPRRPATAGASGAAATPGASSRQVAALRCRVSPRVYRLQWLCLFVTVKRHVVRSACHCLQLGACAGAPTPAQCRSAEGRCLQVPAQCWPHESGTEGPCLPFVLPLKQAQKTGTNVPLHMLRLGAPAAHGSACVRAGGRAGGRAGARRRGRQRGHRAAAPRAGRGAAQAHARAACSFLLPGLGRHGGASAAHVAQACRSGCTLPSPRADPAHAQPTFAAHVRTAALACSHPLACTH
jgi:hypothetical protein